MFQRKAKYSHFLSFSTRRYWAWMSCLFHIETINPYLRLNHTIQFSSFRRLFGYLWSVHLGAETGLHIYLSFFTCRHSFHDKYMPLQDNNRNSFIKRSQETLSNETTDNSKMPLFSDIWFLKLINSRFILNKILEVQNMLKTEDAFLVKMNHSNKILETQYSPKWFECF